MLTHWLPITCILLITKRKSHNNFKCNYLKNQKQFLEFSLHFWNLHKLLHICNKYISLMSQIFGKFLNPKDMLTWMTKGAFFRTPSASQRVHGSITLPKPARHHFYPKFSLIYDMVNRISHLWIRSKMLGLFVKILMADNTYFAHNWEKIMQQAQMQLS